MTIKEYTEKYNLYDTFISSWDNEVVESWELNNKVGDFLPPKEAKRYKFLADNTDGWCLMLEKSNCEEEYQVVGNESAYERFFNGDTEMTEVYKYLLESMEADMIKRKKA